MQLLIFAICRGVPSLYVRVYRPFCHIFIFVQGSLTIREGVSVLDVALHMDEQFPHYT